MTATATAMVGARPRTRRWLRCLAAVVGVVLLVAVVAGAWFV